MTSPLPVSMAEDIRQAVEWIERSYNGKPLPKWETWKYSTDTLNELFRLTFQIVQPRSEK